VNPAALEADLRALGFACTVEPHGALALLVPHGDPSGLEAAALRTEAIRLAEARGFTHVAVELRESGGTEPDRRPGR
jgi:hypothetical protein